MSHTTNKRRQQRTAAYFKWKNGGKPYAWNPRRKSVEDMRRPRKAGSPDKVIIAERYVWVMRLQTPCVGCGRTARKRVDGTLHHKVSWYPKDRSPQALPAQIRAGWSVEALEMEMDRCDPYCLTCWRKVTKP